ncbi:glycoside hydrolase family 19 protein [Bizionia gelidisalsuginis]|uniref:Glycoside hydrolase family 19 protein n=1 Tax=Bizionia gelidisalsuginis TaxID=291188 RepID=A0ABY3M6U6_9FLAO|nr:glycoside hydrolase family 19 protein [Bizionia gelidisalsuginis]TYC07787.1 glycoside hydrolase family 19 protein [Bizionia gelidisalsuginis]
MFACPDNGLLENLVLKEQADSTFRVLLVQYNITDAEKNNLINKQIVDIENKIIFVELHDISGSLFNKVNSDQETCTVFSYDWEQGSTCSAGGNHSYTAGDDCSGWGNPDFTATSGGWILSASEISCGGGGGSTSSPSSPSEGSGGGGTYVPPTTTPVLCPRCPEIEIDQEEDCDTSKEDLKKIFPNMSDTDASTLAFVINDKAKDFDVDTQEKLWHFLAQAGHEVGGFNNGIGVQESTNYTTTSRLLKIFPKYYSETDTIVKRKPDTYINNPSGHANYTYCCRMGNGNEASGDGYKYRGRGIFQLTGKTNYANFKTWYNNKYDPDKDFISNPELLKDNDTIAILSALWFYKTSVLDKITIDSTTAVKKVTKKVNGGINGLTDREAKFTKAKDSITCL